MSDGESPKHCLLGQFIEKGVLTTLKSQSLRVALPLALISEGGCDSAVPLISILLSKEFI